MTTTWNLTREQLADKVLQKVGNLARGETGAEDDRQIVYGALDGIIKELPVYGYEWPQVTPSQVALALPLATQIVSLPADYYAGASVSFTGPGGKEVPLPLVPLSRWLEIELKSDTAAYPQLGYLDPAAQLHVWPIPTGAVSGFLSYQKIISDSAASTASGLPQTFTRGLVYALCADVGDEFGATPAQILLWQARWVEARKLCIEAASPRLPDCASVDD